MYVLGITGTYLGDYFGILMDRRVTSFPFNVTDAPMYYGSTLSFLGTAILYGKPAGILLTAGILAVYIVALRFEEYGEHFPSAVTTTDTTIALSHLRSTRTEIESQKKGERKGL